MARQLSLVSRRLAVILAFCSIFFVLPSSSVKRGDFKTCEQASFCKRNRDRATRASSPEYSSTWKSPYRVSASPRWIEADNVLQATLVNQLFPTISFSLDLAFVKDSEGTVRIKIDELNGLRQRFNEADRWALWKQPEVMSANEITVQIDAAQAFVQWGGPTGHAYELKLQYVPLLITFFKDGQPHVVLNQRGLFNMEHFRHKPADPTNPEESLHFQESGGSQVPDSPQSSYPGFPDVTQEGMWEETFGGRTDSKPKGPESLSLDITFPGYEHVYGIPEHASPLSLKTTRGSSNPETNQAYTDPYRLWNLDVFEYEHDSEMALYGAIPFMKAHRSGSTVGVFWLNAAETWIDVEKHPTSTAVKESWNPPRSPSMSQDQDQGPTGLTTTTQWISESGILDLFVFLGPSSREIFSSFGSLVGTTVMPPYFSIAHHQCRWNYVSQEDLLNVVHDFDKHDIPLDVMWLDIEYAEEHKYFIWDKKNFPEPLKMIKELESTGRKLVTIVDPHIKRTQDLYVYKEAKELGVLCKLPDGSEYEGWCWTGSSSWVDYFDPRSWDWWASLFKFDKYRESTVNVHNWLDMNEPSVFNAPEITMPRDNIHFGGWEHRDLHNLNGMVSHNQSARGLRERTQPQMRGFVLSRSFFAGSQRYGAIWQGDNMGTWEHLAVSIPMLLSNGIAGMAFNGADVGGFFGNPTPELLVRWYQTGAFFPFFRAHAHIDTKRREPYLLDEPIRSYVVNMIKLRYALLPTWYTAFFENSFTGAPIAIPQYVIFPNDERGFAVDDQFYLGTSGLLVKPVTQQGQTATTVYLPDSQPYYNYFTHDLFLVDSTKNPSKRISFPAPLHTLPLFIRGGHIFTRRDLIRRAASLTLKDPITLVVALNNAAFATGTLYLDDGESFNHDRGQFLYRAFTFNKEGLDGFSLSSTEAVQKALKSTGKGLSAALSAFKSPNNWMKQIQAVTVQNIIILGLPKAPTCVRLAGQSQGLFFDFSPGLAYNTNLEKNTGVGKKASRLEIKNANIKIVSDWTIHVSSLDQSCSKGAATSESDPFVAFQSDSCPKGYYQCKNVGHRPSCIRISRVNDGICEPECCDGSDEAQNPDVNCPNGCDAVGNAYKLRREKQMRNYQAGNQERKRYIEHGNKEQARLRALIKSLQIDMISLRAKEQDARVELERVEKTSEAEVAKLKETGLYQKILGFQDAIKSLRQKSDKLEKDLSQLNLILTDLKGGYNPNYQDMAVKGAVKGFEDWEATKANGESSTTDEDGESPEPSHEQLEGLVNEDPVALLVTLRESLGGDLENMDSTRILAWLDSYLPEPLKVSYEAVREFLLEAMNKVGLSRGKGGLGNTARTEVAKAKASFDAAEAAVANAQKQIDEANTNLVKDWGAQWEFKKLDQTCLEINHAEYTYEVCLFGEAFQKSAGGGRTSLGRFAHWNTDVAKGSPEYYNRQVYLNGAKCWNGPERSVKLDIKCGATNSLYSVMEPEKCEYRFKMTSPAVCHDELGNLSEGQDDSWVILRDEL